MKYAKIVNGVVTEVIENVNETDVFSKINFKLSFNKNIDQINPAPQVGWLYSDENGFTEN